MWAPGRSLRIGAYPQTHEARMIDMTLDAALDHRRPRGARAVLSRVDHAVCTSVRPAIKGQVARPLPGGASQWLTPAAGITASIARRVW